MKHDEIVAAVRKTSGLEDTQHAEAATRATLSVLGTRLAGGEPGDLRSQLPDSIADALPETGRGETFGVEEFYRRVQEAEDRDCTQDGAREHARAVIAAIRGSVSEGEFADLTAQLPADYRDDLLSTAPVHEHR